MGESGGRLMSSNIDSNASFTCRATHRPQLQQVINVKVMNMIKMHILGEIDTSSEICEDDEIFWGSARKQLSIL